jgi:Transcriptional activator of glycolytic enzymes.
LLEAGQRQTRPSFECSLLPNPRDLFTLWQEYEFSVGGRKPAKDFTTRVEPRGQVKLKYSRRKVIWECISKLIRSGYSADTAIDKIYNTYGRRSSVTTIINRMRDDAKRGGHPLLN